MSQKHIEEEMKIRSAWAMKDVVTLTVHLAAIIWWASSLNSEVGRLGRAMEGIATRLEQATVSIEALKSTVIRVGVLEERVLKIENRLGNRR